MAFNNGLLEEVLVFE